MAEQIESPPKKQRTDSIADEFDETNPFTKGSQSDEVELKFDTGESLFVSKSFLSHASPVFKRMFQSQFKESSSECAKLTGKKYDAFLDMMLFLHPRIQKPISGYMAIDIYKLAHEYEIPPVLRLTDKKLHKQVQELVIEKGLCFMGSGSVARQALDTAFEYLQFAETYGNLKLSSRAAERISVLPIAYLSTKPSYRELSDDIKYRILTYRLKRCDQPKVLQDILPLETFVKKQENRNNASN